MIGTLLDGGVNVIDTAASYPGSEEFLGEHLSRRRKEFVLISKCGTKIPESDALPWSAELIATSIDRSLRLLKTDHIDVMLLHSCGLQTLEHGEAIEALAKVRNAGKIHFAGYSGDNEAAAFAAALPDVAVVETSISIVDQVNIEMVLPVARKHDVGVIAKRPIANAAWKGVAAQPGMYQDYAKPYVERFEQMKLNVRDLGYGSMPAEQAWPEIALRFAISFPEVSTAIVGTTNAHNAARNLEYIAKGPLPDNVLTRLREAFRIADPNGHWHGQT